MGEGLERVFAVVTSHSTLSDAAEVQIRMDHVKPCSYSQSDTPTDSN